jgi:outer membrane protein
MRITITCTVALLTIAASAQQKWSLQQCLQRADERNLAVRNAQLEADLADKAHDQAYWSYLPDLNAGATHGYNWGKSIDRYTNSFANERVRTNNFYLSSNLTLYNGGRKHNELKQADLNEQASLKGLEAARNDMRTEVVRNFLSVLGLKERVAAAEQQVAVTRDQLGRMQALLDAGRVARAELLDVEAQLATQEYTLTDLRNQRDQSVLALGQALRLDPAEQTGFDIEAPAISAITLTEPTATEEDVLRNVLTNNPAYAQADLTATSAEKSVSIARSGAMPSLMLSGSVGTGYSGRNVEAVGSPIITQQQIGVTEGGDAVYSPVLDFDTRTRPFGSQLDDNLSESLVLQLNIPIFNNKTNSYAIDQARVRHEQAKNDLDSRRYGLQRDVQNALLAQRSAYRQYESARRGLDASEESMRYAQERFNSGTITALELSTATLRVQQSQADLINAKYSYLMAQKSLDILQGLPVTL